MGDKKQQPRPKRVFVSDVDTFSSRYIAEFLSTYHVTDETSDDGEASSPGEPVFQVVGTVSSSSFSEEQRSSSLLEHYMSPTRKELLVRLLHCDVVVYNISENATQQQVEEAKWAVTALHSELENAKTRKTFILISTVMTWAMTKPQNPEETDSLLTEEEFRRRKPHPSFKNHNNLEKLVLKLGKGKSKLSGYVVAAGLQYGKGENLFHHFFKVSWLMTSPEVPVFGQGTNHIPMIHVSDLAGVIQNIVELRPKSKYILAVDDSKNTLEDIVKMISDTLGPGKITKRPEQEAIATEAFTPEELEYLSIDLRLDAFIIKDSFNLRWTSKSGIMENMETVVEEFKDTRQLLPIRFCVVGPPCVGKTSVSEKLCAHYQIHHIKIDEVIEGKVKQLQEIVNADESDNDSDEVVAAAQTQLDNINKNVEAEAESTTSPTSAQLDDELLIEILQEKLNSKPCQNQGFVLDGFPETYKQAQLLFLEEETEEQEGKDKKPVYNKITTPEHVIVLEASDEFLTKRVEELPEDVAEKLHCTSSEFLPRLQRYRQLNSADQTLLDLFDEIEIYPEHIEVTDNPENAEIVAIITELVGMPKNYGPSPEEQKEQERKMEEEEQERAEKEAAEAAKKRESDERTLAEMTAQYDEWKNLSEVKRQEEELLEAHSLPLRNYLMKHVMPPLTEALLECCRIQPDDPISFLAEYLLQTSQQQ